MVLVPNVKGVGGGGGFASTLIETVPNAVLPTLGSNFTVWVPTPHPVKLKVRGPLKEYSIVTAAGSACWVAQALPRLSQLECCILSAALSGETLWTSTSVELPLVMVVVVARRLAVSVGTGGGVVGSGVGGVVGVGVTGVGVGGGGSTVTVTVANTFLGNDEGTRLNVCVPVWHPMNVKLLPTVKGGVVVFPLLPASYPGSPQLDRPISGKGYSIFTDRVLGVTLEAVTTVVLSLVMVDGDALSVPLGPGVGVGVIVGGVTGVGVGTRTVTLVLANSLPPNVVISRTVCVPDRHPRNE